MGSRFWVSIAVAWLAVGAGLVTADAASVITTDDIMAIPSQVSGSGNGTLDLRLFTFSGSEVQNTAGLFDGDNGNNALPNTNATKDLSSFVESYVTTAGELKTYYALNFPAASVHQIVLFLDLNETRDGATDNVIERLDIVLNPLSIQGDPDPFDDVSSDTQADIDQVYTGGSLLAYLLPQPAQSIPLNNQGAGFADYAIFTGVDPFALADDDVLLFNVSMSALSNGAEEIFLSGTYAARDVTVVPAVPALPAGLALLVGVGGLAVVRRRLTAAKAL
jgi:hypothetical protein